ncbi:MAG: hypothetical protein ACRCZP_07755, partial [Phycicoccus sp.]
MAPWSPVAGFGEAEPSATVPDDVDRHARRRRLLPEPLAQQALDDLWSLPVTRWPLEPLAARAWDLGHDVSAYDAAY